MLKASEKPLYLRPGPQAMFRRHLYGFDFFVELEVKVLARQVRHGRFDAHGGASDATNAGVGKQRMMVKHGEGYRHMRCDGYAKA